MIILKEKKLHAGEIVKAAAREFEAVVRTAFLREQQAVRIPPC